MGRKMRRLPKIKNMRTIIHSSLIDNGYPIIWNCRNCLKYLLVESRARLHSTTCEKNVPTTTTIKEQNVMELHSNADSTFKPGDKVLLKNWKIKERNCPWKLWIGPFFIDSLLDNNTCTLKLGDHVLKAYYNIGNIKKVDEKELEENQNKEINTDEAKQCLKIKRYFTPVDELWMASICMKFKLPITSNITTCIVKNNKKLLTKPKATTSVTGDGNCWYRCISLWMTNSEEHHELIRKHVYEFFIKDRRVKSFVGDIQGYLNIYPINIDGTWATEIEIFVTAMMLNTNIYIYSDSNNSWQFFCKNWTYRNAIKKTEKCIYISHVNRNHFVVVNEIM